jgi:hypothetical protein
MRDIATEDDMGRFANEPTGTTPTYIFGGPSRGQPWNGESEWDAMGKVVPMFRRAAAEEHLKQMGFTDAERRFDLVNMMAYEIGNDNSHAAMERAYEKGLDVTGIYRLLAVLLCEPKPA